MQEDANLETKKTFFTKRLFNLNVSQFLAFAFLGGALGYEIALSGGKTIDKSILDSYSMFPLLGVIVFLNGSRIFLASWETEEDSMHTIIKNCLPEYKKGFDWGLRGIWLFLVYLLPFIIHTENAIIFKYYIPLYFVLLYVALFWWDIKMLKWINKYRGNIKAIAGEKISNSRPTFWDVGNTAFKSQLLEDGTKIKAQYKLNNFEEKTIVWIAIDIFCGIGLIIYTLISLTVQDYMSEAIAIWVLAFIIFIAFGIEFVFNWNDYKQRFAWSAIATIVVGLILFFIGKLNIKEESLELLRNELLNTDKKFSIMSHQECQTAFIEYADTSVCDRSLYSKSLDPKYFIINNLSPRIDSLIKVDWKPIGADIANSGDFGYTFGTIHMETKNKPSQDENYCTAWKKEKGSNKWKYIRSSANIR